MPTKPLLRRRSSLILIFAAVLLGTAALAFRPGMRWAVRQWVLPRLEKKLAHRLYVGRIIPHLSSLDLQNVFVEPEPPNKLQLPSMGTLAPCTGTLGQIRANFSWWGLLRGKVRMDRLLVEQANMNCTIDDVDQLRHRRDLVSENESSWIVGPNEVTLQGVSYLIVTNMGSWKTTGMEGHLKRGGQSWLRWADSAFQGKKGASAHVKTMEVQFRSSPGAWKPAAWPHVSIVGGSISPWQHLSLAGIHGTFSPSVTDSAQIEVHVAGSYQGIQEDLWQADGWIAPDRREGDLMLRAKQFSLSSLEPVLEHAAFVETEQTHLDANLSLRYRSDTLSFGGGLHIANLSIHHPKLASETVRGISLDLALQGSVEKQSILRLEKLDFIAGPVRAEIYGVIEKNRNTLSLENRRGDWRDWISNASLRLRIPPVSCQGMLQAIPKALLPKLMGIELKGSLSADLTVSIDLDRLLQRGVPSVPIGTRPKKRLANRDANIPDDVTLRGQVNMDQCKVIKVPEGMDAKKLLTEPFDHAIETKPGEFTPFRMGVENPDYIPFDQLSPHLINSLMTTEDHGFLKHRGFILREFRTALRENLLRGYFRLGASSITMQMVKNVLLSREKTLSRKMQELFLTWYIEQASTIPQEQRKHFIFERYVNGIEYGPGLYGIGPASRHYFGKHPKELTPREVVWYSSILPNPKERYLHYCHGAPSEIWEKYLDRILTKMHERARLTDAEWKQALSERLAFSRAEFTTKEECIRKVREFQKSSQLAASKPASTSDPQK